MRRMLNEINNLMKDNSLFETMCLSHDIIIDQNDINNINFKFVTLKNNNIDIYCDCSDSFPFSNPIKNIDYKCINNNYNNYNNIIIQNILKCFTSQWSPAISLSKLTMTIISYINTFEDKQEHILNKYNSNIEYINNINNIPIDIANLINSKLISFAFNDILDV